MIDLLPAGLSYVSSSATQGAYDPLSGIWSIGSLGSQQNAVLTLVAHVAASATGTTIINSAQILDAYMSDVYGADNYASVLLSVGPVNYVQASGYVQ